MSEIGNQIVIQSRMSWIVTIQNFNLIAQSVLKLSHRKKVSNDNNNDDDDDDDTHPVGRPTYQKFSGETL